MKRIVLLIGISLLCALTFGCGTQKDESKNYLENMLQNRKNLLIEKKAMALCIVAVLLVFIPMLVQYYIYDHSWGMIQAINEPLWRLAYLFAACVFFLRAFRIR